MSLSIEELTAPRYKVIADYPKNDWELNEIICFTEVDFKGRPIFRLWDSKGHSDFIPAFYDKYPHLFRKLEWWEDRKPEEMPKYVKLDPIKKDNYLIPHRVFKIYKWKGAFGVTDRENEYDTIDNRDFDFIPATETEYLNYINSKK